MITFTKCLAFCFALSFISSSQAVKIKISKTKLDDKITELIIANYENKSFNKYDKCTIQYHSEIDTDAHQSLSILKTKIKIPKKSETHSFPHGTQLFRYKLLSAYNAAKEQKRLKKDGRIMIDRYTSLHTKPLFNPFATETEAQSTQTSNKLPAKEIICVTVIPEIEYKIIKNRWIPQSTEPPLSIYT